MLKDTMPRHGGCLRLIGVFLLISSLGLMAVVAVLALISFRNYILDTPRFWHTVIA
jgi:hypothetical protein